MVGDSHVPSNMTVVENNEKARISWKMIGDILGISAIIWKKYHGIWNITSGKHLKITVERSTHFYHGKTPYFNGHFQ